jgi:hypothetical protein
MIRTGGVSVVLEGLERGNIRFARGRRLNERGNRHDEGWFARGGLRRRRDRTCARRRAGRVHESEADKMAHGDVVDDEVAMPTDRSDKMTEERREPQQRTALERRVQRLRSGRQRAGSS